MKCLPTTSDFKFAKFVTSPGSKIAVLLQNYNCVMPAILQFEKVHLACVFEGYPTSMFKSCGDDKPRDEIINVEEASQFGVALFS